MFIELYSLAQEKLEKKGANAEKTVTLTVQAAPGRRDSISQNSTKEVSDS